MSHGGNVKFGRSVLNRTSRSIACFYFPFYWQHDIVAERADPAAARRRALEDTDELEYFFSWQFRQQVARQRETAP